VWEDWGVSVDHKRHEDMRGEASEMMAGTAFSIEKSIYTKRTQLKNAHVFLHETVMKKQSWVRYAKKSLKMGEKVPKYRSGRVVLWTNEPNLPARSGHRMASKRAETGGVVYNCGSAGDSRRYNGAVGSIAPQGKS
jgi:uncharacterized protein YijF (DUF1287 family)